MPSSDHLGSYIPYFQLHHSDFSLFYDNNITWHNLLSHAQYLSDKHSDKSHFINLCQDRYLFSVVFMAGVLSNRPNLLPPNQAKQTLVNLLEQYPGSLCMSDDSDDSKSLGFKQPELITINPTQVASISFTSGSTGQPKAVAKTWREFEVGAKLATRQLALDKTKLSVIATVPLQHMYGLETGFFWPLFSDLLVDTYRPFFPEDIRKRLASATSPGLLVATPKHLQSCVDAKLKWHNVERILSSTAVMPLKLAEQIEACFNAPLDEIYGSTETLSFATRRVTVNPKWQPYQGMQIYQLQHNFMISGGHLEIPVSLDDKFDVDDDGRFSLLGRSTDMIKIAGKRASLLQLNNILQSIPEIEDGVFYVTQRERLGAIAVGKIGKQQLLNKLRQHIDPVFLPRPLYFVEQLPRNEVGKFAQVKLEKLIEQLNRGKDNQ